MKKAIRPQKPLALLDRIIKASSTTPATSCATPSADAPRPSSALTALDASGVGCDLSTKAVELVVDRIKQAKGLWADINARETPPRRTDKGDELNAAGRRAHKQALYGKQGGHCQGCGIHYMLGMLEMDHVIPKSKGGTDHDDNFQLLCGACNKLKRNRSHAHLMAELARKPRVTWS